MCIATSRLHSCIARLYEQTMHVAIAQLEKHWHDAATTNRDRTKGVSTPAAFLAYSSAAALP